MTVGLRVGRLIKPDFVPEDEIWIRLVWEIHETEFPDSECAKPQLPSERTPVCFPCLRHQTPGLRSLQGPDEKQTW